MPLLDEPTRNEVQKILEEMDQPVRLVTVHPGTRRRAGMPNLRRRSGIGRRGGLAERNIRLEVRDIVADAALAEKMQVDKIPALAVLNDGPSPRDYGIRLVRNPRRI